jgi:hypothetical protein
MVEASVREETLPGKDLSVPLPRCLQITGGGWVASWRRSGRKRIFQYSLFLIQAVGTDAVGIDKVSLPKPNCHSWPGDCDLRLSNLFFAGHPSAQFLSSILVNNSHLIFTTVVVYHVASPWLTLLRVHSAFSMFQRRLSTLAKRRMAIL